jgi:hypothetical protein
VSDAREALTRHVHPSIVLAGFTGAGKTTLARAVLGPVVPADAIGHGVPSTRAFLRYSTGDLTFWDSRGLEPGDTLGHFRRELDAFVSTNRKRPLAERVHLGWFVIQAPGARVTPTELELLSTFPVPVLVVLTKGDIARSPQVDALRSTLATAGILPERIFTTREDDASSWAPLMEASRALATADHCAELARRVDALGAQAWRDTLPVLAAFAVPTMVFPTLSWRTRRRTLIATRVAEVFDDDGAAVVSELASTEPEKHARWMRALPPLGGLSDMQLEVRSAIAICTRRAQERLGLGDPASP